MKIFALEWCRTPAEIMVHGWVKVPDHAFFLERCVDTSMQQSYVSDIIGEDFKSWRPGRIVLDAGTGSGKTTFIIKSLLPYVRELSLGRKRKVKILYLCNRVALQKQIFQRVFSDGLGIDLEKYDTIEKLKKLDKQLKKKGKQTYIDVWTYQALESLLKKEPEELKSRLERYTYIVCDETHYFFSDVRFHPTTEDTYLCVDSFAQSKVIIYMSATAQILFDGWEANGSIQKRYRAKKDYSYINENIYFYYADNERQKILDTIPADEKALVFVVNIKTLRKMKNVYGNSASYYCSQNNSSREEMDSLEDCIKDGRLQKRFLFTTTALYNGIDIKDSALKHIIIEQWSPIEIEQEIGRKRPLNAEDTCTVYLRARIDKQLINLLTDVNLRMLPGWSYLQGGETWEKFLNLPDSDEQIDARFSLRFSHRLKAYQVNSMVMTLCEYEQGVIKMMRAEGYPSAMMQLIWAEMGKNAKAFSFAGIKTFIQKHINEPMSKEAMQGELMELFSIYDTKRAGYKSLNKKLRVHNVQIITVNMEKHKKGDKVKWKLVRL